MSIQTVLTGAGVVATVSLGVWAIVLAIRYRRTVQITYAYALTFALTDDLTQNFPDLQVLFRGQPVSDNLVLLKGYLVNSGKRDITPEMVEKPVTLVLPEGFEWVECKIAESSPDLEATANVSNKTKIAIDTGLWKTREYLKIEALAKVPVVEADVEHLPKDGPTSRLEKALCFSHRIADSTQIVETQVPRSSRPLRRRRLFGLPLSITFSTLSSFGLSFIFVVCGGLFLAMGYWMPGKLIGYRLLVDGKEHVVSLGLGNKDGTVVLKDPEGFKKICTFEEFDNLPDKHSTVRDQKGGAAFAAYMYFGFGILLLALSAPSAFRDRRLLAMIVRKEQP